MEVENEGCFPYNKLQLKARKKLKIMQLTFYSFNKKKRDKLVFFCPLVIIRLMGDNSAFLSSECIVMTIFP